MSYYAQLLGLLVNRELKCLNKPMSSKFTYYSLTCQKPRIQCTGREVWVWHTTSMVYGTNFFLFHVRLISIWEYIVRTFLWYVAPFNLTACTSTSLALHLFWRKIVFVLFETKRTHFTTIRTTFNYICRNFLARSKVFGV